LRSHKKKIITASWVALFFFFTVFSHSQNAHFIKLSVRDYPDFSHVIIGSSFSLPFHIEKSSSSFQDVKTIVIDPGHGGLGSGAKGKFGTLEKDITLAIGFKLKAIIERNLAFRVVLTRESYR
jgi:N-acetylmuramoyl-L-alanine amidase